MTDVPLRQVRTSRIDPFLAIGAIPVAMTSLVILSLLGTVLAQSFIPQAGKGGGLSLDNFVSVFSDPQTYQVLLNSLQFSATALVVAFAFGLPIAWLVESTDLKGKNIVLVLVLITLLIPGFASAAGWLFLLHPRIGLANVALMQAFGLASPPFNILTLTGMGWVEGLSRVPLAFLMTSMAFRAMDRSLQEAALTAGAPQHAILRRIVLPILRPALLSALIYILMITFSSFDVPAIIGWGNRIFTFSTYMYLLTNPQDVFPGYGPPAALSTVMIALALVLIWWARSIMRHGHRYAVITGKAYRPHFTRLGRHQVTAWALILIFVTCGLLLPLLLLLWSSLLPFLQLPSAQAMNFVSLGNYRSLPWGIFFRGLQHTALLALLAPPLVLTISLFFSWFGFRSKLPGRELLDQIAFVPHAIPHIVLSMGLLLIALYVVQPILPIYGTVWALLFAFAIGWLSYGTRITNAGLLQVHQELEESARLSGASTWGIVRRIVLPLLARGLLLAWLYIAILTARELTLSVLLSTPGNMTLPVMIWSLWLDGGLGHASASMVCVLALVLPLMGIYVALLQRQQGTSVALRPLPTGSALAVGNAR
jgi:iron(III) transport system permease protein